MPYGDAPGAQGGAVSPGLRIDWKSALLGGTVAMAVAYVGILRPAQRQLTTLEGHVTRLAAAVTALNDSRQGV